MPGRETAALPNIPAARGRFKILCAWVGPSSVSPGDDRASWGSREARSIPVISHSAREHGSSYHQTKDSANATKEIVSAVESVARTRY